MLERSIDELLLQAVNYGKLNNLWETQWQFNRRDYIELFKNLIEQEHYAGITLFLEAWRKYPFHKTRVKIALETVYETAKTNYSKNLGRCANELEKLLDNR